MTKPEEFGFDASAFLVGTQLMSHSEVGQYIRILSTMSDKGRMTIEQINSLFGEMPDIVRSKFKIDAKKQLYNVRLEKAIEKALKDMEKPKMTEQESLDLKECKECYFEWYEKKAGIPPKIFGADINALKSLIAHFRNVIKKKNMTDTKPVDSLQLILDNWNVLDNHMQQQTKLVQINSNINNIIIQLKNGGIKRKSKVDGYKSAASRVANLVEHRKSQEN